MALHHRKHGWQNDRGSSQLTAAEGSGLLATFIETDGQRDHARDRGAAGHQDRPESAAHAQTCLVLLLLVSGSLLARQGAAQENFEIQVYGSETVPEGSTMIELHSNVAARGTTTTVEGVRPTQGAFHETIEITHGWTPWFETGAYLFTSIQPDGGWQWVGDHIRPRIRAPDSWELPVGLSLSVEVGYQQRQFSVDTWTLEARPIIDRQQGPWYVSLNPTFDYAIRGLNHTHGMGFSPSMKVSYGVSPRVALGLEYYGAAGPVGGLDSVSQQQHQLFPVLDLDLGPRWEFNFGVGAGLTPSTDRLIVKLILGYRFDLGSGSGW
jgi:hypothetical protein